MSFILGLDVGTEAGAAATKRDGYVQPCELEEQSRTLPSVVVLHDDGTFLTGSEAEQAGGLELVRVARDLRRDPMLQADPVVVGSQVSTPYAMLRALHASAVERVCNKYGEVPTHVVVTHPALPEGLRCDVVERIADELFPGALLVPEPVAATVKFACDCVLPADGNVAVYDFGGGTLDLSLVRRDGDRFSILSEPTGMSDFGGIDIDDMVLSHVDAGRDGAVARLDLSGPEAVGVLSRLRAECRVAKERLSYEAEVTIDASLPESPALVTMRRHELEELLFGRLDESIDMLEEMIEQAGLRMSDVDALALVGGSSRIPLVAELIRARTHIPVVVDEEPELTVALGAAQMVDDDASSASVFPVAGISLPNLTAAPVGVGAGVGSGHGKALQPAAASGHAPGGAYRDRGLVAEGLVSQITSHAQASTPVAGPAAAKSPERQGSAVGNVEETEDDEYVAMFGQRTKPRMASALAGGLVAVLLLAGAFYGLRGPGGGTRSGDGESGPAVVDNAVLPSPTEEPGDEATHSRAGTGDDGDAEDTTDGPDGDGADDPSDPLSVLLDPTASSPSSSLSPRPPSSSRPPTTGRPPATTAPPATTTTTSSTTTTTTTSTTTTTTTTTEPPES